MAYLSLLRHAWAGIIISIITCSLSKLASYISKKRNLDRIEDLSCEWSSSRRLETPAGKAAFEPRIPEWCLSIQLSGMWIRGVPEHQWYASKSCGFATNKWAYVSYFDSSTEYRLVCFDCQMGFANMQCRICHKDMPRILWCTWTSIRWVQKLPLYHK